MSLIAISVSSALSIAAFKGWRLKTWATGAAPHSTEKNKNKKYALKSSGHKPKLKQLRPLKITGCSANSAAASISKSLPRKLR